MKHWKGVSPARWTALATAAAALGLVSPTQAQQTMEYGASGKVQRQGHYLYRKQMPDGSMKEIPHRGAEAWSVARHWNETLLECIRHDKSRPTVHARNLYHIGGAMWDAWVAYSDGPEDQVFHHEHQEAEDVTAARNEAISYAAYRILLHRFQNSVGAAFSIPLIEAKMVELGYDGSIDTQVGDTPAALGNRIAQSVIDFGMTDNANEVGDYANQYYEPVNEPLIVTLPGNPEIVDPNHWQPLAIEFFVDQSGNPIPFGSLAALSPEWGYVTPFALEPEEANVYPRDGFNWWVYDDPGPPPYIGLGDLALQYYKFGFETNLMWSAELDPTDGVVWDISPGAIGGLGDPPNPAASEAMQFYDRIDGGEAPGLAEGYDMNPVTGMPYTPQLVPRGDYTRILAEFWADGPNSETPPGHWFTILNYVSDYPGFEKRFMGQGPVLDDLEWDVKAYLVMGGAMHDIAITCWGTKGWYDFIRPVCAIRYMADRGQSTDPFQNHYNPLGLDLIPGFIELVTPETTMPGGKHEHLAGSEGKIAVKSWRGPDYVDDPEVDDAGVGWILAENWWPYQRPNFVSPPFPGYYSGHSTYSRCAADVMGMITGSPWFPGGLGEFEAPQNEFLVFEEGPSVDCVLQWGKYADASDQCSLSRLWGGIHPPADDLPGRVVGHKRAPKEVAVARRFYNGQISCPADFDGNRVMNFTDVFGFLVAYGNGDLIVDYAPPFLVLDFSDVLFFLNSYASGCP
ncbi:MAG: vanadium-dependent haloperoxidase [Phycisphaerales bacterium]